MSPVLRALVALAIAPALTTTRAAAMDCTPPSRQSSCLDADSLWVPAGKSGFAGIPASVAPRRGEWTLGLDATYLSRPVRLTTASPDPAGREVHAVDDVWNAALSAAGSPARRLELAAVLPLSLARTGTGLVGVTSQSGERLPAPVLRDVRLQAGYELFRARGGTSTSGASVMARLGTTLPTGAAASFAGARGVVVAPALALGLDRGRFFAAAEESVRLRQPVTLGTARLGSQLVSTLGVGARLLPGEWLSLAAEAWVMPSLVSGTTHAPDGTRVTSTLVPAEWLLSLRTRVDRFTFLLGGGGAIPLSAESRVRPDGTTGDDTFAGLTTPRYRGVLVVRADLDQPPREADARATSR